MRWRGHTGEASVFRREYLRHRVTRKMSPTDVDQRANDVTDHLLKKARPDDCNLNEIPRSLNREGVDRFNGRLGAALGISKGGEIMCSDETLRDLMEESRVERSMHVPYGSRLKDRRRWAIHDAVGVLLVSAVVPGVKLIG